MWRPQKPQKSSPHQPGTMACKVALLKSLSRSFRYLHYRYSSRSQSRWQPTFPDVLSCMRRARCSGQCQPAQRGCQLAVTRGANYSPLARLGDDVFGLVNLSYGQSFWQAQRTWILFKRRTVVGAKLQSRIESHVHPAYGPTIDNTDCRSYGSATFAENPSLMGPLAAE